MKALIVLVLLLVVSVQAEVAFASELSVTPSSRSADVMTGKTASCQDVRAQTGQQSVTSMYFKISDLALFWNGAHGTYFVPTSIRVTVNDERVSGGRYQCVYSGAGLRYALGLFERDFMVAGQAISVRSAVEGEPCNFVCGGLSRQSGLPFSATAQIEVSGYQWWLAGEGMKPRLPVSASAEIDLRFNK